MAEDIFARIENIIQVIAGNISYRLRECVGLCMKNRLTCRQGYCGGRGDICSQVCIWAQCTIGSDRVTAKATDEIAAYISRRKTATGKICTGIPDFRKMIFNLWRFLHIIFVREKT